MIKSFKDYFNDHTKEEVDNFLSTSILSEKIDGHYVTIEVLSKFKLKFLKSNKKEITHIDLITNNLWTNLTSDWQMMLIKNQKFFEDNVGLKINLFYIQRDYPLSVDYSKLSNSKTIYLISSISSYKKNLGEKDINEIYQKLISFCNNEEFDIRIHSYKLEYPNIDTFKSFNEYEDYVSFFRNEIESKNIEERWSSLGLLNSDNKSDNSCEGLILDNKDSKYQIVFIEPKIVSVSETKLPFEFLMADLCKWLNTEDLLEYIVANDYIKTVCNLFNHYIIEHENVYHRISKNIEYSDLIAPGVKDLGINYEYVPSEKTRVICKSNMLYACIFKIMLINLRSRKSSKWCTYMTSEQITLWNKIISVIDKKTSIL